ncbi:MAG: hypothetical protein Q8S31_08895 [Alphaproteobacteria bacterium]|nr:hypothetical protein [Alphaproteobacteria bacterium]
MRKSSLFVIFMTMFVLLGFQIQTYANHIPTEERLFDLFPSKFTQEELDRLRDQKPVLRDDLLYSMDEGEAQKLAAKYPSKAQIITSYGFADRVEKKSYVHIDSNYNARALYGVKSPYLQRFDDKEGFYVKVERIIDTYSSLLDNNIDQSSNASLILIRDFDEVFIQQTAEHHPDRLMNNLARLIIVLGALESNVFQGTVQDLFQTGKELLVPYIAQKIGKNVRVDQGAILSLEDINNIANALKQDIFQKIGIDPSLIPQLVPVQMFFGEKDLLARVSEMSLLERYELRDPSLVKIDLFSAFQNLHHSGVANILSEFQDVDNYNSEEIKILALFPDRFTQAELDFLKDLKPVFKADLVYSLNKDNADKLYANYPYGFQVLSGSGFPERVVKSGNIIIESDHVAYANYIVKSAYAGKFDDSIGFNVKIERIIDANIPLLGFSAMGEDLDNQKATALVQIKELDRNFVRGNEFVKGNGYDKRLNGNLAKFLLVLKKFDGEVFDGSYDLTIRYGQGLLRQYIFEKIGKDVAVDEDVLMDEEDFYVITDLLKQAIYQKIGIDPAMIPSMEDYAVNFLAPLGEDWLQDIASKSLTERYAHNDPALLKIKLLTN